MRTLAVPLLVAVASCGGDAAPAPGPARVRLVDLDAGELVAPAPAAGTPLLSEDFAHGLDAWSVATDPEHLLDVAPGLLAPALEREDGRALLALHGRRGALYRVVPAEPDACYAFNVWVRARGIESGLEPFDGAAPWLAELSRAGDPAELLGAGFQALVERRHAFDSARGHDGWQERRLVFRAGPNTRALVVACFLTLGGEVSAGSADFRDLELVRVPESALWRDFLGAATANSWRGELVPQGWRGERLLRASIGAEVRPSILLFPGETLRLHLALPSGAPRLELGLGPWSAGLVQGAAARPLVALVRVDGRELLREASDVPGDLAAPRWRERQADLAALAGRTVELELAVEGELPVLFGAPVVRDARAAPALPNVLLVSIDTLRADHVGCYGYPGGTTPRLDALAREGVLFRNMVSQAPYTLPAHATLFSGQMPSLHDVQRPSGLLSSVRSPLLTQILARAGLRTQAFTGGVFLNADFGFDKGFDAFDPIDPLRPADSRFFQDLLARARAAVDRPHRGWDPPAALSEELVREHGPERVLRWLGDHAGEPFFLFLHTYVVHDYDPPPGYLTCHEQGCTSERVDFSEFWVTRGKGWVEHHASDADRAHLVHRYDAALRYVDEVLGRLLDRLDELGIARRTVVVVTSDHGEELLDRGSVQHGKTLFEELLRVPLVVRVPGRAPRVVEEPAMSIDVAPTILGALGLPADPRMQGIDLLAREPRARPVWSEIHDDFVHKEALRDPSGWKLIHAPPDTEVVFPAAREWSLFHLTEDPLERDDRADAEAARLAALRAELERERASLDELARALGRVGGGELNEETQAQLRQLGYVE